MKRHEPNCTANALEQVYLIDRDAGLLCRILGLYASRGIDVQHMDYAHAAQSVMKLSVRVTDEAPGDAETLRVLVDKVKSLVGVLAAEQIPTWSPPAPFFEDVPHDHIADSRRPALFAP